jgi:predicted GNAT family acetyltransferase
MSKPVAHQVRDNVERKRFEIDLGDGSFAFTDYDLMRGKILFKHTEVPEAHEGEGLGSTLIRAGLAAARERDLKVIPICPFFAAYMQKHPEVQDLLDDAWRIRFGLPSQADG